MHICTSVIIQQIGNYTILALPGPGLEGSNMSAKKPKLEKEKMKTKAILVPHTHWDREWYSPLYVFRIRLVKMIDNLLTILANDPKFTCFTFDGQVIPLEDYLEVRPERQAELKKRIEQGRIAVGPFYILPDNFLISGEAHIRNLLLGMRISEELGKLTKIGYIPDAFGQIAQTPQIFQGFGLNTAVFERGFGNEGDNLKSEFIWRAPDGESSVLAHWLTLGYGNLDRVSTNMKTAVSFVTSVISKLKSKATTNNVLLMNGTDHLEAQPHIPLVVQSVNESNSDVDVKIGTIGEYFRLVKAERPSLQMFEGEFRGSKFHHVVTGVTSTRTYLKQKNAETQTLLERWVEPFDAWTWSLGERHNHGLIWQAWKYTLQCHPHDDICGCGVDSIHDDMMKRFTSAQQLGESVLRDDLTLIASKISISQKDYALVVFNPLNWSRTDVVESTILAKKSTDEFELTDPNGKHVNFCTLCKRDIKWAVSSKIEERIFDINFLAEDIPPCGYKTYKIKRIDKEDVNQNQKGPIQSTHPPFPCEGDTIDNEYMAVKVEKDGSITLTDRIRGKTYSGLNTLEDGGDVGDEYNYDPPKEDRLYSNKDLRTIHSVCTKGTARSTLRIEYELQLPARAAEDRRTRWDQLIPCRVTCEVSLAPKVPRVDFVLEFDNNVEDHRLRVVFPTGLASDHVHADQAFHVIRRPISLPSGNGWIEPPSPTYPMQSYVSISDREKGITITARGLQEYEAKEGGTIAITLLRCVGWLSGEELSTRIGSAGPIIPTPGAQCLGKHSFSYSVIPHGGTWEESKSYMQAMQHQTPMRIVQVVDHDFAIGDPSVVPAEFRETVTRTANLQSHSLPLELSFLKVEPANILVSTIKQAEDGIGIIVRVYNTTREMINGKLKTHSELGKIFPVNMREEPLGETSGKKKLIITSEGEVLFEAPPFKVRTFKLILSSINPRGRKPRHKSQNA